VGDREHRHRGRQDPAGKVGDYEQRPPPSLVDQDLSEYPEE